MLQAKTSDKRGLWRLAALATALIMAAMLTLAGCGGSASAASADSYTVDASALPSEGIEPTDTIIVCAVGRGQAFRLPEGALAYAKAAIQGERYVGVVLADGSCSVSGMRYELTRSTEAGRAKEVRGSTQDYLDYACSLRATAPGINLLESINTAANELRAKGDGPMTICVVTSGITDGTAATTPELLSADARQIVPQLASNGSIANYDGITVRFYGVGQSTGEQAIPDSTALALKALWREVITEGGGEAVFCTDILVPLGCDAMLPEVTRFDYPADSLVIPELAPAQTAEVVLGEDVLTFVGDSDAFADAVKAKETLETYANAIRANGYTVSIVGYTADSPARSPEFLQELSENRARAVARSLVECGVSESSINSVEGRGPEGSTSMATGAFDEVQASLDRRVVLTINAPVTA